jgi:uncharacterized protein
MLIGILSDTHDQVQRTRDAADMLISHGADQLIHCGDLTTADVVYELANVPSYFVLGNCDYDEGSLRGAIDRIGGTCMGRGGLITLGERTIAVTHGHLQSELDRLAAAAPDYLLFGHTHRLADDQLGPTRWINPGALHRASTWTVALLNLASNQVRVLSVINGKMHR